MPEEERVRYSAMTGKSLFYIGGDVSSTRSWRSPKRKAPSGRRTRSSSCSRKGELTIASTGKDPHDREARDAGVPRRRAGDDLPHDDGDRDRRRAAQSLHRSHGRRGPRADPCDPSSSSASADARRSARKRRAGTVLNLHRNAQRLLRPVRVVNDYARLCTFLDSRDAHAARSHEVPHAHPNDRSSPSVSARRKTQLPAGSGSSTSKSLRPTSRLANELAHEVLGRSLDELAPQTRRLLEMLDASVTRECARRAMRRVIFASRSAKPRAGAAGPTIR